MLTISKLLKGIGIFFGLIVLFFSAYGGYHQIRDSFRKNAKKTSYVVYEEMNMLSYFNSKYELVNAVDKYIKATAPQSCLNGVIVVNRCIDYDVDICFVLAQGQVESHFGTNGMARKTNSVWNVFAFDGLDYDSISSKGKYQSPDESIEPYLELITSRYMVNGISEFDLMNKYVDVNGKRYASATNYESTIRTCYNNIKKNTPIDSLALEMKKFSIILGY